MTIEAKNFSEAIRQQDLKHAIEAIRAISFDEKQLLNFYESDILSLMKEVDLFGEDEGAIWKEHMRSELVLEAISHLNPLIENGYLKNKNPQKTLRVLLVSPEGEQHILGLRLMQDILKINGIDTLFSGANLPNSQVESLMNFYKPHWVIISVTNSYHLILAKKAVGLMKKVDAGVGIIGTGRGFEHNLHAIDQVIVKNNFREILSFVGGLL